MDLSIEEIVNACKGKLICGNEEETVEGFSKDTRNINKGDMYVGIKGENFDGNTYYREALEKGAIGAIIEEEYKQNLNLDNINNKNIIIVKNGIKAIQDIATYKRSKYNIPVIAVTGSVGKTSTKDIIAGALSKKYNLIKTEGNNNNHIGLPLTILKLKDHNAMVVEMGMNHLGEISTLTNIAKPTICVITNVGTSHIGNLGSRENILKAKLEIIEGLKKGGPIIVNNDNDLLHEWAVENFNKYNIVTYGIKNKSDYMAYNIKESENSSQYNIDIENKTYTVNVPVSGNVFVYNSLSAIAVSREVNESLEEAIKGISEFELTKKRMEITKKNGITIINDSYNASYDSMKAGLEYLKTINARRKIAVLGDMLELGEFSKELHEKVGEEVAKNDIDILITVGKMAKNIAYKAKEKGVKNINSYLDNERTVTHIKEILEQGDVILFKASNSMKFGEIVEKIIK